MTTSPNDAAIKLASIVYADLSLEVSPGDLITMIRRRWNRIAPLAHAIHDAPDQTKSSPVATPDKPLGAKKRAAQELRRIVAGLDLNDLSGQAARLREVIAILEPTP